MTKTEKEESEFGSGLIVNLAKFSEHFMDRHLANCSTITWWLKDVNVDLSKYGVDVKEAVAYFGTYMKIHGDTASAVSSMITLWANGATDHLYDLRVPKRWENTELANKVIELRELGLSMGHGFTGQIYTMEDVTKLRKLVQEICLGIDKQIGIKDGDWGQN